MATNLRAMCSPVRLYADTADDRPGSVLAAAVRSAGVELVRVGTADLTTTKTRYYEGGRLVARVDDNGTAAAGVLPVVPRGSYAAVVLTDYGKGAFAEQSSAHVWASIDPDAPVFVDPYPGRAGLWRGVPVDTMAVNWSEAEDCLFRTDGFDASVMSLHSPGGVTASADDDTAARYAFALRSFFPLADRVIVKRGRYGSTLVHRPLGAHHLVAVHVRPYLLSSVCDAQGAGDTYLAGYVTGRVRGLNPVDSAHLASAAAGVAVSRPGTATVTLGEAAAAAREYALSGVPAGAVIGYDDAAAAVRRARGFGLKVGLTTGCFDLRLHAGHRHVLSESGRRCDALFAAVDSDDRVRRLKGPSRPVLPSAERAAAVAAVAGVRCAFVFDCQPADLLRRLDPDYLFKGGDYPAGTVPEVAESGWAGTYVHVGEAQAESTTQFIRRVAPEL